MTKKKEIAVETAIETVEVELVESTTEDLQYKDIHELINLNKKYNDSLEEIQRESENILESFFNIGNELSYIQENKFYLIDGYKNIYELAEDKFNFKKTTTHNMIAVFNKYKDENKELDEKYSGYSFSSLVELLPVPKEEITEENFNPGMTVKEIRNSKFKIQLSEHFNKMVERLEEVEKLFEDKVNEYNSKEPNKKLPIKITKDRYNLSEDNFNVNINYSIAGGYSYYYDSLYYANYNQVISFKSHDIMKIDNVRLVGLFVESMRSYIKYAADKIKNDEKSKKEEQIKKEKLKKQKELKYKTLSLNYFSYSNEDFYLIYKFIFGFMLKNSIDVINEYSNDDNFRKYEMNNAYVLYLRKDEKEICKLIIATGGAGDYLAFDYSKKDYICSDKLISNGKSGRALLKDKDLLLDLIKDQCSYIINYC